MPDLVFVAALFFIGIGVGYVMRMLGESEPQCRL